MCVSILSPKAAIRIVYASESVWLKRRTGIPDIILDVLVQNDSQQDINTLWCIVPQRLFQRDGSISEVLNFSDRTEELSNVTLRDTKDKVFFPYMENAKPMLRVNVVDPTDLLNDIEYRGTHYGNNRVVPLQDDLRERMVANFGPFGVLKIEMKRKIEPQESRWMRLSVTPLSGPRERRNGFSYFWDYVTDRLNFHYNVAGPAKVRYEVKQHLAHMEREIRMSPKRRKARALKSVHIANMIESLVKEGIDHPATKVVISDWRTRFFLYPMESFSSIETDLAVRSVGPHPLFPEDLGRDRAYYEWATGDLQIATLPPKTEQGYFNIRFATKYTPRIFRLKSLLAVLGFVLGAVSLYLALAARG